MLESIADAEGGVKGGGVDKHRHITIIYMYAVDRELAAESAHS